MHDAEWEWKAQQHVENAQRRAQEATKAAFRHEEASAQAKARYDAAEALIQRISTMLYGWGMTATTPEDDKMFIVSLITDVEAYHREAAR